MLITGGSGGLGRAVVEAFVATGATVHVPSKGEVAPGARHLPPVDVTDEGAVIALFSSLPPLWASIHVVGGFLWKPFMETPLADVKAQLEVNLVSAFLCTREAGKKMRGHGGRIVNVASHAAVEPATGQGAYAPSKAALVAMTKVAALELRSEGILVNAIAPTIIDTPANRAAMPDARHDLWAKPAQIAATIVWLCSTENTVTSGALVARERRLSRSSAGPRATPAAVPAPRGA